jgi:hypothetical protein
MMVTIVRMTRAWTHRHRLHQDGPEETLHTLGPCMMHGHMATSVPLEARCSYLFLVSAVCLKFFVILVPILVSSVILQIVSSAFMEVSFRWWWWIQIDLNLFCKIFCWQCACCRELDAGNVWRRRLYKWRSGSGDKPVCTDTWPHQCGKFKRNPSPHTS